MVSGRALSLGSVAILAGLSIAFGAWSATTNPDIPAEQLHDAVENVLAASSLVVSVEATETVAGTSEVVRLVQTFDYEAPDRVYVHATVAVRGSVSVLTFTQVASSCWSYATGTVAGRYGCSQSGTSEFFVVLRALLASSDISRGSTYQLSPKTAPSS